MVKVSFVFFVSTTAPTQFHQTIRALFGSSGGFICMRVITSEYRSSDPERCRAAKVSADRSSSPRHNPQPSGRRRTDPYMVSA